MEGPREPFEYFKSYSLNETRISTSRGRYQEVVTSVDGHSIELVVDMVMKSSKVEFGYSP